MEIVFVIGFVCVIATGIALWQTLKTMRVIDAHLGTWRRSLIGDSHDIARRRIVK
jgi:uncharacterized membrane protein